MRKKIFVRIFAFSAATVILTALLITLAMALGEGKSLNLSMILGELPYIAVILIVVLALSIVTSMAITKTITQPIEELGENIENIESFKTCKELTPFAEKIKHQNDKKKLLDKQKKQFTANVSHELKTPLTSIAGYAELIENGMVKEDDIKPFAHTIRKQALRLVTLAEDIIKLSQLEENDSKIIFEEVNIKDIITECAATLQVNASSRNISLNVDIKTDSYVTGNKSLLEELVYNLCDNAIRYNKDSGNVDISVYNENNKTVLCVSDTGIGIPDKYKDRICERFFRVDKSRSKETGGTGLGLAIVKHIAEVHNAKLIIDSKENIGTKIEVIFG